MSVNLVKGQCVNLKKESPNLNRIMVGLGWDPIGNCGTMDIDASIICIKDDKTTDVVYYRKLDGYNGAIQHKGDNLTGDGDGDDEQIEIKLNKIPNNVEKLAIVINIYAAHSKNQSFEYVNNCFVHITDMDTNKELVRYNVSGNFNGMTGLFVADIYRHNQEWKIKAIGEGANVSGIMQMVDIKLRQ